eukprot:COSAG01_NODE_16264_length_1253_cov_6.659445_2_plen_189_part_00
MARLEVRAWKRLEKEGVGSHAAGTWEDSSLLGWRPVGIISHAAGGGAAREQVRLGSRGSQPRRAGRVACAAAVLPTRQRSPEHTTPRPVAPPCARHRASIFRSPSPFSPSLLLSNYLAPASRGPPAFCAAGLCVLSKPAPTGGGRGQPEVVPAAPAGAAALHTTSLSGAAKRNVAFSVLLTQTTIDSS